MLHRVKSIKRLRTTAFVITVSALSLATLYAKRREPALVRIGEIKPHMNFSTVCVQGLLESEARVLRDGTILYLIADETGSMPAFLSRAPNGKLPRAGSRVAATGVLRRGGGGQVSMRVQGPGQIKVLGNAAPSIVAGLVVEVESPPPGSRAPYRIILDRPAGRIEVVHWFAPEQQASVGERVEATGTLGFYNGRMQLKVRKIGDIQRHPEG
jgi:hypothetical protein